MTTAAFSTTVADDLLIAFVSVRRAAGRSADGDRQRGRAHMDAARSQQYAAGTSEIWSAKASGLLSAST
jgi:hypothetical protein